MSSPSSPASRLADAVKTRRAELALNQLDVARAGGPSNTTLTEIENERVDVLTQATAKKLDKGLQWKPGSAMGVWRDGVNPVAVGQSVGGPAQDADYVSSPGPRAEAGLSDADVLAEVRAMRERLEALERRLSQPGS